MPRAGERRLTSSSSNPLDATRVRAVTHLDITTPDIERAVSAIGDAVR